LLTTPLDIIRHEVIVAVIDGIEFVAPVNKFN